MWFSRRCMRYGKWIRSFSLMAALACSVFNGAQAKSTDSRIPQRGDVVTEGREEAVARGVAIKLLPVLVSEDAGPGAGYLVSIDSVRNDLAVRNDVIEHKPQYAARYNFKYVENVFELQQQLAVSANASYGGASARATMLRESRISRNAAYVLVKMSVSTYRRSLVGRELSETARREVQALRQLSVNEQLREFKSRFGDAFVASVVYGGELMAVLEFSAESAQEAQTLRAAVKGATNSFSGSVSATQAIQMLTTNRSVQVRYVQSGGMSGSRVTRRDDGSSTGGLLVTTPDALIRRIEEFPAEVERNAKQAAPLYAELLDYSTVTQWPAEFPRPQAGEISPAFERVSELRLAVQERLATVAPIADGRTKHFALEVAAAKAYKPYLSWLDRELERRQRPYLAVEPTHQEVSLPSFEQYRAENQLEASDDVSRANAGALCTPLRADIDDALRCLFSREDVPSAVAAWQGKEFNTYYIVQAKDGARGTGDALVNCHGSLQDTADKLCNATRNGRILATLVNTYHQKYGLCDYRGYKVTCMQFDTTPRVVSAARVPTPTAAKRSGSVDVEREGFNTVIRFTVQTPLECEHSFGAYSVRTRTVREGETADSPVAQTSYWMSRSNEKLVEHVLPGRHVEGAEIVVTQLDAFCEPRLNERPRVTAATRKVPGARMR